MPKNHKKKSSKIVLLSSLAMFALGGGILYKMYTFPTEPGNLITSFQSDQNYSPAPSSSSNIPQAITAQSNNSTLKNFKEKNNSDLANSENAWQRSEIVDSNIAIPETALENTAQIIKLNSDFIEQTTLNFSLPNGQDVQMERKDVAEYASGSRSWSGSEKASDFSATITQNGKAVAGNIQTQDGNFEIASLKNGTQIIYQVDTKKLDQMSNHYDAIIPAAQFQTSLSSINPKTEADANKFSQQNNSKTKFSSIRNTDALITDPATAGDIAVSEITVLFAYTQAAVDAHGLDNLIVKTENAITAANTETFPSSQVNIRIRPVAHVVYSHSNSADIQAFFQELSDNTYMNLEALRDQHGADLVQGITVDSAFCGYGSLMTAGSSAENFRRHAYSAVSVGCIDNSTVHEIGHNLGLNHNKENANDNGFVYNYGYRYCQTNGFRTVMAYACDGAPRVKRFSNPNVVFNGLPTGVENIADNASILENKTRFIAVDFRGQIDEGTTPIVPPPVENPTSELINGKQYRFLVKHSNKALGVDQAFLENAAKITQYDYIGAVNQKWTAMDKGDGYWQFQALHSGKCLDVSGVSQSDGANFIQWNCHGHDNQLFKIDSTGDGYFYLRAKHSDKCVDVSEVSQANNALVHQWSCIGQDNAKWKFEEIN